MDPNGSRRAVASAAPVVVGIDGSRAAARAAEWAAAEALSRDLPLRLVQVVPDLDKPAFRPGGVKYRAASETLARTRRSITEALPRTGAAPQPGGPQQPEEPRRLEIDVAVLRGRPDQLLLELSESAELMVLGRPDTGFLSQMVLGDTALAVTRDAHCPIALVPPTRVEHGAVLAVADTAGPARAALATAARAARTRGGEVTVARVWHGRSWQEHPDWTPESAVVSDAELVHCVRQFPDVVIRPITLVGDPLTAVETLTAAARLVVVAHESTFAHPDRLGRITQELVRYAPCPVLVVPDRPPAAEQADADRTRQVAQ
ncbi:universal stress protein [Nocardia seriolae]|uniref:Universal stress protein n=3 Tax=Nocardia seriolae TaxID=37332 RepID=A0ABC9YWF0_9NOCA|nr:universal stress protein [Nocardia seriolae]APA98388.1 Universal stress protein [Nocardia seriolae]MTJ64140.1 hypothetical protein [Nocardia seriolae]MTJ72906.1 hypothetical protein [Nocardia seriolae]MTK48652.1 hypothetical protein [Nocardia seriolae]OJF80285.1 hypothetical protein NS14008_15095 [Nocardia seriolae]